MLILANRHQRVQNIQIKAIKYKKPHDNGSCINNTKSTSKSKEIHLSTDTLDTLIYRCKYF